MNLLTQHVGSPAGTIGPGALKTRDRYGFGHAVTLMRLRGYQGTRSGVAKPAAGIAPVILGYDQQKPEPGRLLRHHG
jgi:hypothetical protein